MVQCWTFLKYRLIFDSLLNRPLTRENIFVLKMSCNDVVIMGLKCNHFGTTNDRVLSKLLASLIRSYFPKRLSGAPLHTLSKLYDIPVVFLAPPPLFEAVNCFICGRRRVTVARYRMICLVFI